MRMREPLTPIKVKNPLWFLLPPQNKKKGVRRIIKKKGKFWGSLGKMGEDFVSGETFGK
jgi:hypothetical protein